MNFVLKSKLAYAPESEGGAARQRVPDPEVTARQPSAAEDRWLGSYLRRAYDSVVDEPLPSEFDDLLRRLAESDEGSGGGTGDGGSAASVERADQSGAGR